MPAVADNRVSPGRRDHATAERHRHRGGSAALAGWERRGNEIVKTFVRKDFAGAMTFVNEVVDAAEAAGHHPDIDIRWNKVTWPCPATPRVG
jgi:pterin-4a-carbinolamine dehydratase